MKPPFAFRTLACLTATALLAACGGGESAPDATAQATDQVRAARLFSTRAGSGGGSTAAAAVATNAGFFKAAQTAIPSLFPGTPTPVPLSLTAEGVVFDIRAYVTTGYYLAVGSNNHVYGLGPMTGGNVVDLGEVNALCTALGWDCSGSTGGGGGGSTGPLNGCTEGASVALQTGRRFTATYRESVLVAPTSTGEHTTEGVVNGPASFEGASAVKMTTVTRGVQMGVAVDATVLSYHQASDFDLTRTLGTEISATVSGFPATIKAVWTAPASLNNEYSLAAGGSMTKTEEITTSTAVTGLPMTLPPTTTSTTTTYTFEGRESVTVPAGTYTACRYKTTTAGSPGYMTMWVIDGRGVSAKVEHVNGAGVVEYRTELKSATVNGAAL